MKVARRIGFAGVGLFVVVVFAAGWGAEWALKNQLMARGADRVEVEGVYVNPWLGYAAFSGVKVHALGRPSFSVQALRVNLALLDLVQRQIRFSEISIQGLDVAVERSASSLLVGVPLDLPSSTVSSSDSNSSSTPGSSVSLGGEADAKDVKPQGAVKWHWAVDQLRLEDGTVSYTEAGQEAVLSIDEVTLTALQTWNREAPGHLNVRAGIRVASRDEGLTFAIETLDFDADVGVFIDASFGVMWHGDGGLKLRKVAAELEDSSLIMEMAALDVPFSLSGWPNKSSAVEGWLDINAQDLTLSRVDRARVSVAMVQLNQLKITSLEAIKWDELRVERLQVLNVGQEVAGQTLDKPLLSLPVVKVSHGEMSDFKQLSVENVTLEGAQVYLVRGRQGQFALPDFASPPADGASAEIAASSDGVEPTEEEGGASFSWSLAEFQLMDDSQLTFVDEFVSPTVTHVVSALALHGKDIRSDDALTSLRFQVDGQLNQFGTFEVSGEPAEREPQFETEERPLQEGALEVQAGAGKYKVNGQFKGVELPDYSPYLSGVFGYQFKSGQLFLDANAVVDQEAVLGEVGVRLNNVHLRPFDQAVIKRVSKQLAMPLDTALNTLRDKNGDVRIDIPVDGPLSNPAFSMNDVMRQVTLRALKMATVSMIKHAIQPYGTAVTAAQLLTKAGKRIAVIKVQDLKFAPGESALDPQAKLQLDSLARLLASKEKLRLNICAYTTLGELDSLSEVGVNKASKQDLGLALAAERSVTVKRYLHQEQGVAAERLYLCQSQVDTENGAFPRVELSL